LGRQRGDRPKRAGRPRTAAKTGLQTCRSLPTAVIVQAAQGSVGYGLVNAAGSEDVNDHVDDESTDEDVDDEPSALDVTADERKLVTQPYDFSVDQLANDVRKGRILLIEVPYQREYVWDDVKASRLIESLLLNVPIPVCYFAENEDGTWEVIDGLQRAHSIVRFLSDKLALKGLLVLTEFNGKTLSELPARDQRRIETRTLRFVVVTAESHPDIKFDVFERLNTGAVKLTPQELRNCIYRGTFNTSLKLLSSDTNYRAAVGRARDTRMRDEELALRFAALVSNLAGYKPPLTQFLNEYMRKNRSRPVRDDVVELWQQTMEAIAQVFAGNAFRGMRDGKTLSNLNRALFDAVALSVAFANRGELVAKSEAVQRGHKELLEDPEFQPLIGRATADRTRMHGRVLRYASMLQLAGVTVEVPKLPES
jgi:hypothetical protein